MNTSQEPRYQSRNKPIPESESQTFKWVESACAGLYWFNMAGVVCLIGAIICFVWAVIVEVK